MFGAIAHFERRLIAERTKDGIAAARTRGKRPGRRPLEADKIAAALSLVKAGLSPTDAAKQLGLGRSTNYREVAPGDPVFSSTDPRIFAVGIAQSYCSESPKPEVDPIIATTIGSF